MNDPDGILRERYVKEADDVWFRDMEMDERLKSSIRAQLPTEEPRSKHRNANRRRRVYPLVSAAALLILIAALQFGIPNNRPDTEIENGNIASTVPEGTDMATGTPMSTFTDPGGVGGQRAVASIEDARAVFAGRLLVPAYVPDGYTLTEISAYGESEVKADKIVLRYTAADAGEFTLTASLPEAQPVPGCPNGGESIRIGGEQGCLRTDADGPSEIYWTSDRTVYVLTGNLPADQLTAIAETSTIPGGE